MTSKNSKKGAAKLASILQNRMTRVAGKTASVNCERGEIVSGKKLKLYSIPGAILDRDDYSVCATIYETDPLRVGDLVLVNWTFDGEPVVIDKIKIASKI